MKITSFKVIIQIIKDTVKIIFLAIPLGCLVLYIPGLLISWAMEGVFRLKIEPFYCFFAFCIDIIIMTITGFLIDLYDDTKERLERET